MRLLHRARPRHASRVPRIVRASVAAAIAIAAAASTARGEPPVSPSVAPPVRIAARAPADDVRRSIVIGATGEVYEPDGHGRWVHKLACSTATPVAAAGRAGGAVVALGQGVVYR